MLAFAAARVTPRRAFFAYRFAFPPADKEIFQDELAIHRRKGVFADQQWINR